ncbi:Sulfotransfer 1 domain containing protein [Asbolus verrucosus]|uniref:Sulfotransfer 1 domain containing protein n=1 Tax=Asbolus verrucosus TaxID=1661398 RepID=A0A482VTC1_ASBVE|nr:Sulfotransfer 1 domain containing protein [Asbolus verrucosus]
MEKVAALSDEELNEILKKWTGKFRYGYTTVKGCTLPQHYLEFQKDIDDFEVFDSDIWICSFPRTGTTWMSEMVWLIANNFNYEKAKTTMFDRMRFIENPLDACVSYYYHAASMMFTGSLEEFCKLYLSKKMPYGPFWEHILPFWRIRDQENLLFLKYEDLKQDLNKVIRRTSTFLGKSVSDEEVHILQDYLSFESMKKNSAVSGGKVLDTVKKSGPIKAPFIRSGKVGGYKAELPQNFVEIFESWMESNLEGTGLSFQQS